MKKLEITKTKTPDFSGFKFYVEAGREFDLFDYVSAYGLDQYDIDPDDIHSAQDAAAQLMDGEWLEISHVEEGQ